MCTLHKQISMSSFSSTIFDINALRRLEQEYRSRLLQEPGDTGARLNLAWCLVILALFKAGQEETLTLLMRAMSGSDEQAEEHLQNALQSTDSAERTAAALLRGCLQQITMVSHLSRDPQEKSDAKKLQDWIHFSGGREAVREADERGAQVLFSITHAIATASEHDLHHPSPSSRTERG